MGNSKKNFELEFITVKKLIAKFTEFLFYRFQFPGDFYTFL